MRKRYRDVDNSIREGDGLGAFTKEEVENRARELAWIRVGDRDAVRDEDRDIAEQELSAEARDASATEQAEAHHTISRDPETPGARRHEGPEAGLAHDEQEDPEKMVEQAVSDAQHEQMKAARSEALRQTEKRFQRESTDEDK